MEDILTDTFKEKGIAKIILDYKRQMELYESCDKCKIESIKIMMCYTCSYNKKKNICKKCCIMNKPTIFYS